MVFVNCFPFFLSCRFFFFLRYLPILKTPYAAATPTTTTLFNSQSPFEEVQKAFFFLKSCRLVQLRKKYFRKNFTQVSEFHSLGGAQKKCSKLLH